MKGYAVVEKSPAMNYFYYEIIIDGKEVKRFYPYKGLSKSDFREYLDECQDLVGTIDEDEVCFWLPLYIVYKCDITGDWDADEDIFSSYSLKDTEMKYNDIEPSAEYKIMLLELNEPSNFASTGEIARDDYEVIKEKSLKAQNN